MESDHLAVKMYMNTDAMKGYWKLNTTCLKCKEITQAFTEEIQLIKQLKVFNPIKCWNVGSFKEEMQIIEPGKEQTLYISCWQHTELQTQQSRSVDEDDYLYKLKSELTDVNG